MTKENDKKTRKTTKNKKVTKESNNIVLGILAVCICSFVGIVWAAFAQTLNVKDSFPIKSMEKWNIHLDNLSQAFVSGLAKEIIHPTIDNENNSISNFEFVFSKPGDSGSYTFDIVNSGDVDARLTSLINTEFICKDKDGSTKSKDAINVCNNLSYEIRYTSSDTVVSEEDTIKAKDKVNVTIYIIYDASTKEEERNLRDVHVSGSSSKLIYSKEEKVLETTGN